MFAVGLLHNQRTGRVHPILFTAAPLPSGADRDIGALRHRSRAHHTAGFATRDEALTHVRAQPAWRWTGVEWTWDGATAPCLTAWFSEEHRRADLSA